MRSLFGLYFVVSQREGGASKARLLNGESEA